MSATLAPPPPAATEPAPATPIRPGWQTRLGRGAGAVLFLAVAAPLIASGWLPPLWPGPVWLGMTLFFFAVARQPSGVSFQRGAALGGAAIGLAFHWIPAVCQETMDIGAFTATVLFAGFVLGEGLQWGLGAFLAAWSGPPGARWAATYAVYWTAIEFLTPRIFPWRLGHSQVGWPTFVQLADLTGVYGVSFLLAWSAALAALLLHAAGRRFLWRPAEASGEPLAWRRLGWESAACGGALLAALLYGAVRERQIEAQMRTAPTLRVALVQGDPAGPEGLAPLRRAAREAGGSVDLVVWPESTAGTYSTALPGFDEGDLFGPAGLCRSEPETCRPLPGPPAPLLCVGRSYEPGTPEDGPYYVTTFLVDERERILGRYRKRHLIPMGEYVPGDEWFPGLASLVLIGNKTGRGESAEPLDLPRRARLGCLICYEDMDAGAARTSTLAGADVLIAQINGAGFGETEAVPQHEQLAHFRAVENRRTFLRCATTGLTEAVSPLGRTIDRLPPHQPGVLTAAVPRLESLTLYTRWGDWFAWGTVAAAVLLTLRSWRRRPASAAPPV